MASEVVTDRNPNSDDSTEAILLAKKMVECEQCQNLLSAVAFQQSVADPDGII